MEWREVDELRQQFLAVFDLSTFQIVRVCDCGSSAIVFHCRVPRGVRRGASATASSEKSSDAARATTNFVDVAVKVHFCYSAMAGLPLTGPEADAFARRLVDAEVCMHACMRQALVDACPCVEDADDGI